MTGTDNSVKSGAGAKPRRKSVYKHIILLEFNQLIKKGERKMIKKLIQNIWWRLCGKKQAMPFSSYEVHRYGRVIHVIRYHDTLIVVTENSMWQIKEDFDSRITAILITDGRI